MTLRSDYWQKRRLGRRPLLGAGAATGLGALGLALVGCGDDDSGTPAATKAGSPAAGAGSPAAGASASATAAPKRGGTFKLSGAAPVGVQDPQYGPVNTYTGYYGDPLINIDNVTHAISPHVIEKWEQPDPATLILHVRPNVKFFNLPPANGRAAEAKDVVYMIKSMTGTQYPGSKLPFARAGLFLNTKDPTAVDTSTVRLETTKPRADLVQCLAERRVALTPEGLREAFGGPDSLQALKPERFIGTGPYIITQADSQILMKRNPDHWQQPYPYIDNISVATTFPDPGTVGPRIIAGEEYYYARVDPATVDLVKRGMPNVQVLSYAPNSSWYHIGFNTRTKPLDDPRVRQALSLVFDKPAFGQVIFGKDDWRYPGPLPWSYKEAIAQDALSKLPGMRSPTTEDFTNAKQLLSAAGYDKGFNLSITAAIDQGGIVAFKQVAEHLAAQAAKYLPGVKIDIDGVNYTAMLAKIASPDGWNMYTGGWYHEISPTLMMFISFYGKGSRNSTGYASAKMDAAIDSAFSELDDTKRAAYVTDMQQTALTDWSHMPTHHNLMKALVHPSLRDLKVGSVAEADSFIRYAWIDA